MREGWKYKKLGDVCAPKKQITRASKAFSPNDEIAYIDISSIDNSSQKMTGCTNYVLSDAPSRAQQCVQNGDIIVSTVRPNLKNIAIVDSCDANLVASSGFCVLRPSNIERNYLFHYIISDKFTNHLMGLTTGANYPAVRDSDILDSTIPVPPVSVQQSIVSELDKISELIRLKNEQLSDYDKLTQSIFYEMFGDPVENEHGWEIKKLGELSDLICNGNTPKGGSEVYVDTGFLFLRSQNVWKNRIELDDVAYIDDATHKLLKKSSLKHNDLLITKTGRLNTENSSLGRTALFEGEDNSANINGHVYLVRLKEGMVHKFVLYILISNSYRELIRKTCVGGIDKRQLNKDHIEDFPIIFPPIELQKKYVERVELIEKQKEQIRSTIQDLETLLASRMQYWFD